MARGFQAHPPSIHAHASRTGQRADQVSQAGSALGGAGLHGNALGLVGTSTAGQHQQLASRGQSSVNQAGSRLQGQASLLHQTGNNITDTDSDHAGRIRAINPPVNNTRNPHAESGPSTTRSNGRTARPAPPPRLSNSGGDGTSRAIPDEANQTAQWIRDHRENGSIITHIPKPDGTGNSVGKKLHPVVWNGTGPNPQLRPNPNGSTYGGRVFGDHTNELPKIPEGNWDNGGYFKLSPGASGTNSRKGQYYEFDVHPTPGWRPGGAPDRAEDAGGQQGRIVAGDDGSMYYSDHYQNFQPIQGPTIKRPPS